MPKYPTHLFAGGVSFAIVYGLLYLRVGQALEFPLLVAALAVSLFFSVLPDVDADQSKVNNYIEIALLLASLFFLGAFHFFREDVYLFALFLTIVVQILIRTLKHRGLIHTIRIGLALSALVYALNPILAPFALVAWLSHLFLDKSMKF